jgi:hypothetical protein
VTVVALIVYYVIAIGLIAGVAYFTARQSIRRSQALTDEQIARMHAKYGHTPPLEPYVRESLPELPAPELCVTVRRHPETDIQNLPASALRLIAQASRLEEAEGGRGLALDLAGSREEKDRLVLRLTPNLADAETDARLAKVAEVLNAITFLARDQVVAEQSANFDALSNELLGPIEVVD